MLWANQVLRAGPRPDVTPREGPTTPFLGKPDGRRAGAGRRDGADRKSEHKPEVVTRPAQEPIPSATPPGGGSNWIVSLCHGEGDTDSPSSGPLQRQPSVTPTAESPVLSVRWSLGVG